MKINKKALLSFTAFFMCLAVLIVTPQAYAKDTTKAENIFQKLSNFVTEKMNGKKDVAKENSPMGKQDPALENDTNVKPHIDEESLDRKVREGKLTEDQKKTMISKIDELNGKLKGLKGEALKQKNTEVRRELKEWAKSQKIQLSEKVSSIDKHPGFAIRMQHIEALRKTHGDKWYRKTTPTPVSSIKKIKN